MVREQYTAGTLVAERYRLTAPLGKGTQGTVWEALDLHGGTLCALKFTSDQEAQSEFVALTQVEHRSLPKAHGVATHQQSVVLVSERVSGQTLDRVEDERAIVRAIFDCADALSALHDRGLVHGDIKPANILVGSECAWLVDLGFASELSAVRPSITSTLSPAAPIVGTLAFLAPEAFVGERSAASDLFALGVTAVLSLTHSHPFVDQVHQREALLEALAAGLSLRPSVRQMLSPALGQALFPLLSQDPGARGSARTFMARLHRDVGSWLTPAQRSRAKNGDQKSDQGLPLVGRSAEFDRAKHGLQRALNERSAVGLVLAGREGSGRSRMSQELLRVAKVHCAAKGKVLSIVHDSNQVGDGPTVLVLYNIDQLQLKSAVESVERLRRLRGEHGFSPLFLLATTSDELSPHVPPSVQTVTLAPLDRAGIEQLLHGAVGRSVTAASVDAFYAASEGLPGRCVRLLQTLVPEVAATATKTELAEASARLASANAAPFFALAADEQALFLKLAIGAQPLSMATFSPSARECAVKLAVKNIARIENQQGTAWLSLESPVSVTALQSLPTSAVSEAALAVLAEYEKAGAVPAVVEARACFFSGDSSLMPRAAAAAVRASREPSQDPNARIEWLWLATQCVPSDRGRVLAYVRALMWSGAAKRAIEVLATLEEDPESLMLRADVLRLAGASAEVATLVDRLSHHPSASARAVAQVLAARAQSERGEWSASVALLSDPQWSALFVSAPECPDSTLIRRGEILAFALLNLGQFARAQDALDQLHSAVERCDEPRIVARVASLRGMVAQAQNDHRAAQQLYAKAWALADAVGDVRSAATYAANLGGAELLCGSLGAAKTWFDRAARSLSVIGSPFELARALVNLASLEAFLGDRGRALSLANQGEKVAQEAGDPGTLTMAKMTALEAQLSGKMLSDSLLSLAERECELGRVDIAEELYLHAVVAAAQGNEGASVRLAYEGLKRLQSPRDGLMFIVAEAVASVALDETSQHQAIERAKEVLVQQESSQLELWVLQWAVRAAQRQSESAFRRAKTSFDAKMNQLAQTLPESSAALFRDAHRLELAVATVTTVSERTGSELRWRRLAEIARELNSETRLRPLLERIMDAVVELTGGSRGFLLLAAPDGALRVRTARNLGRSDLSADESSPSRSIAEHVAKSGKAIFSVDASSDRRLSTFESVAALQLRSVLAVPLVIHGHPCGTIYVDDRFKVGAFGDSALEVAQEFAEIAAIAIHNARNGARLRRALRQSERLQKKLAKRVANQSVELEATRRALTVPDEVKGRYEAIVGRGQAMRKTLALCDRVAATAVSVLLLGETGTGKELIARAIHANSPRAKKPFVAINCGALTETLLESELFGHLRGAFTGADRARQGLFEVAHGGTIFLDEVAEMTQAMQTKLLRVLQEGEVRPVGGTVARKVDVRVIAATHRDVLQMVSQRTFREDLYYRLAVMTVSIPALRERKEDIPELVAHVLEKHHRMEVKVDRKAMIRLMDYGWPGNVRQLENEVQRAALLSDGVIRESDLEPKLVTRELDPASLQRAPLDLRAAVEEVERAMVERALKEHRGNQTRAAVALGVSRFGLQKMLKRLGISQRTAN